MRLDNSAYMAEYCPYLMLVIVVLPIAVLLAVQHSAPNDLHLKSAIKVTTKSNHLAFRFCLWLTFSQQIIRGVYKLQSAEYDSGF